VPSVDGWTHIQGSIGKIYADGVGVEGVEIEEPKATSRDAKGVEGLVIERGCAPPHPSKEEHRN